MYTLEWQKLYEFMREVFLKAKFPVEVAEIAAGNLLKADLRGIDSHGCARLSGYIRLVNKGRINPEASPRIVHETPSTATLDGDAGLGLWVAGKAMQIAIEKAEKAGSGWVAVNNSSHFGIAAAHAELAIERDMIGFAMTNASPLVAPAGAREAYLGTNPICVTIPAGKHKPYIIDMATSAVSNGKLEIASRAGKNIPEGWALDHSGTATDNPGALKDGGTLLPLGSDADHSYHKGYGLGGLVDIMTGVLSGANFGSWVPPFVAFLEPHANQPGKGMGHFVGAWRIDAFQPADAFKARMDQWIEGAKALKKAPGVEEVLIPGEPEFRMEQKRRKEGIPISEKVREDLLRLKEEMGIKAMLD